MELLRLAVIRLSRPAPRQFGRWPYTASNGLTVHVQVADGVGDDVTDHTTLTPTPGPRFLFPRETELGRVGVSVVVDAGPLALEDGVISVPDEPRERAEAAIIEYADTLGVMYQCKRVVRSPQPCVAMRASLHGEAEAIAGVHFIQPNPNRWGTARVMPPTYPHLVSPALSDRRDGLALLADSLAEDTAVGRCRDLFRLFERAFRRGPSETVHPLTAFLRSNPNHTALQYDEEEVRHWLERLRAEAVHADRRPSYARSVDVEPYLARMEFAAYDVLFNKERWRDPSARRRTTQHLMSAVGPDRKSVVMLYQGADLLLEWIDHWGIYPLDTTGSFNLPPEWRSRLALHDADSETVE